MLPALILRLFEGADNTVITPKPEISADQPRKSQNLYHSKKTRKKAGAGVPHHEGGMESSSYHIFLIPHVLEGAQTSRHPVHLECCPTKNKQVSRCKVNERLLTSSSPLVCLKGRNSIVTSHLLTDWRGSGWVKPRPQTAQRGQIGN